MPDPSFVPAGDVPAADLHAAFAAAFADYLHGPFDLSFEQWPAFTARQCVDLAASRVARLGGAIHAFALVAPRPERRSWRLATMGAVPAARGSGAAAALLDDFIARARAAGQAEVELECFAQNERAVRLYRGRGFEPVHELHGYSGAPGELRGDGAQHPVESVTLEDAFAWLEAAGPRLGGLPLQVTPACLRALPVALRAWRSGRAQLIAAETAPGRLSIQSLVDEDAAQRSAQGLAAHLIAQFPGHAIDVPQLQREDLGGQALERAGLRRLPLHQLLMRRRLSLPSGPG